MGILKRASAYLFFSLNETKNRVLDAWDDFGMALAAAMVSALAVAAGISEGKWWATFSAAFAAGLCTVVMFFLLVFLKNTISAPRRARRAMSKPVPSADAYPHASVRFVGKVKATDVMQGEAAVIATLIRDFLERRSQGVAEQPSEREWIRQRIEYFGDRAATDEWITSKSRKRAIELFRHLSAEENLEKILQLCVSYQKMKPSF